jgi:hypothetical protein
MWILFLYDGTVYVLGVLLMFWKFLMPHLHGKVATKWLLLTLSAGPKPVGTAVDQ